MTVELAIETYRKLKTLPSQCHLNWLKENFNPILKDLDSNLVMNWGCNNCVKNYMNMLVGWYDRKQAEQKTKQAQPKPKVKRKKTNAKKQTTKKR